MDQPYPSLPSELWEKILSFLDSGEFFMASLVCKDWRDMIIRHRDLRLRAASTPPPFSSPSLYVSRPSLFVNTTRRLEWALTEGGLPRSQPVCQWIVAKATQATEHAALAVLVHARTVLQCPWSANVCALAAGRGCLALLQWAREHGCHWTTKTCAEAALHGHAHVLRWARANDCPWDATTCEMAAKGGHLDILKWARTEGCQWNMQTIAQATCGGHVDVLEWAVDNGCDWYPGAGSLAASVGRLAVLQWAYARNLPLNDLYANALHGGHLSVLQWAESVGILRLDSELSSRSSSSASLGECPNDECFFWALDHGCGMTTTTEHSLARRGRLDLLQALVARFGKDAITSMAADGAACGGQIAVLEWLESIGAPREERICTSAAHKGHLETIKWLHTRGCVVGDGVCLRAATYGFLPILQWARSVGACEWSQAIVHSAASTCNFDIVVWAVENGCSFNHHTIVTHAARSGRIDVLRWALQRDGHGWLEAGVGAAAEAGQTLALQWLLARGCSLQSSTCEFAAFSGSLEILRLAREAGIAFAKETCKHAAHCGQLETLQWLREEAKCEWDADVCINAARNGDYDMLRWAIANGCPHDKTVLFAKAAAKRRTAVMGWLEQELKEEEERRKGEEVEQMKMEDKS